MRAAGNGCRLEAAHGAGVYGSRGLVLVRGEGCTVWDEAGRAYLDCTAMYGVAALGHAHPGLAAALAEQAGRLVSCFGSWANDRRAELLARLAGHLDPLNRIFLCSSGSEAVEAALKLARLTTGRVGVVALQGAFHGRTLGALSATFRRDHRRPFEPLLPDFLHVPRDDPEALDAAVQDHVGALLLEPVQGEGGVRVLSRAFLAEAQRLCRERGALLIADEVQTGFGRTGRWFGYQHAGLEPDMVCLAKGMGGGFPMGAVALGPRAGTFRPGLHGSTFGGSPLGCAAALATLEAMEAGDLPARAADVGAWALDRLRALHSPRIREVRGLGLMIGIELRERSAPIQKALQECGVLVLGAGPNVLRMLPPLVITREELGRALDALEEVLA